MRTVYLAVFSLISATAVADDYEGITLNVPGKLGVEGRPALITKGIEDRRTRRRASYRRTVRVSSESDRRLPHPGAHAHEDGARDGHIGHCSTSGMAWATRHRWHLASAAVLMVSAAFGVTLILLSSTAVSWAEVTKAINQQEWIRAQATYTDGTQGTIWLSPTHGVSAFKSSGTIRFSHAHLRAKYEYRVGSDQMTKLPLGADELERMFPMDALARDKAVLGPWLFGTEKILEQSRQEVEEDGEAWVDFKLVLWRGDMDRATLRVDPKTRLPVYVLLTSSTDPQVSIRWRFDYPAAGPSDIYALGVPPETEIEDRMPGEDGMRVFDAMAASRARIGDFRMIAMQRGSIYVAWRKGDRWRIDQYRPKRGKLHPAAEPKQGQSWDEWLEEQLAVCEQIPLFVCDGAAVYRNSQRPPVAGEPVVWETSRDAAPQDFLSSEPSSSRPVSNLNIASLLYPDLLPKVGFEVEFDWKPADAPHLVVIKRSAQLASPEPLVGHEWYYVDPAKGHAVIRAELFNLPPDVAADPDAAFSRQTVVMEDFKQSPQGFWYAATVHNSVPVAAADGVALPAGKAARDSKSTVRYRLDFSSPIDDSLFEIGQGSQTR